MSGQDTHCALFLLQSPTLLNLGKMSLEVPNWPSSIIYALARLVSIP